MPYSASRAKVQNAYRTGFRQGLLSILYGSRHDAPRVRVRRDIGSPHADRVARHRDAARFGGDIPRIEDLVR